VIADAACGANMFLRWSSAGIAKTVVPESVLTPPAGFEVYPVDLAVGSDGLHVEAAFGDTVTSLGQLPQHLVVQADTTPMPITSVTSSLETPPPWWSRSPRPSLTSIHRRSIRG